MARKQFVMLLVAALAIGCASSSNRTSAGKSARDTYHITAEELTGTHHQNAYDLIRAKRPQWLQRRGTSAMRSAGEAVVYVDGTRTGGPEALRRIMVNDIQEAEYLNASEAMSRYGLNHTGGAILLLTRRSR
jgi:hypothetical protein